MRTPISYYGGKMSLVHKILPLIPPHDCYCEPFFGGGAVFFAKEKVSSEIINDSSDFVINFFKVLQLNFDELKRKVDATPFSRQIYKVALDMYRVPHLFTDVQRAWAFWVLTALGFSGTIGSFSYDKDSSKARTLRNKRLRFTKELSDRLSSTQIENTGAIKVINSRDTPKTFNFIDPPYIGADQGHYKGYTENDFKDLLDTLTKLKGKFLLTTYDSNILTQFVKENGWYQIKIEKPLTASNSDGGKRKRKVEVFTMNYLIEPSKDF